MDWYAETEFVVEGIDADDVETIAPRFVAAYYTATEQRLRVRQQLPGVDGYAAALDAAQQWTALVAEPAVRGIDAGARVLRVAVESAEAILRQVGPADLARLLDGGEGVRPQHATDADTP